jgi:hypothetical protein
MRRSETIHVLRGWEQRNGGDANPERGPWQRLLPWGGEIGRGAGTLDAIWRGEADQQGLRTSRRARPQTDKAVEAVEAEGVWRARRVEFGGVVEVKRETAFWRREE